MTKLLQTALLFTAAAALAGAPLGAQTAVPSTASGGHLVVPLSHPGQPMTLTASVINGAIKITAYGGKDVVIDSAPGDRRRSDPEPAEAQGMRLLTGGGDIEAQEDNNTVTVHSSIFRDGGMAIQVPRNCSLNIHALNDALDVTGVDGDINVQNTNGRITLNQVAGSIVASAMNGKLLATVVRLDSGKPSAFSSMNGNIDVTLPADARANVTMKTDQGNAYIDSGFNFQVQSTASAADSGSHDGMRRLRIDNTIRGALNGGGPDLRLQNFNGNIYLRKAK